ncbi:MAG: hypothetical protein Q9M39_06750 [Sulfurovum sp.]|nr:hypothetical protein [Sulfurovum sp.]
MLVLIHSRGDADLANISFTNVTLGGTSSDARFTNDVNSGGSAADIEELFDNGTGNTVN